MLLSLCRRMSGKLSLRRTTGLTVNYKKLKDLTALTDITGSTDKFMFLTSPAPILLHRAVFEITLMHETHLVCNSFIWCVKM